MAEVELPDSLTLVPEGTPAGSARNVAQAYARMADAIQARKAFDPDFEVALRPTGCSTRFERSAAGGSAMAV